MLWNCTGWPCCCWNYQGAHPLCKHLYAVIVGIPDNMAQVREGAIIHDQQQCMPSAGRQSTCSVTLLLLYPVRAPAFNAWHNPLGCVFEPEQHERLEGRRLRLYWCIYIRKYSVVKHRDRLPGMLTDPHNHTIHPGQPWTTRAVVVDVFAGACAAVSPGVGLLLQRLQQVD